MTVSWADSQVVGEASATLVTVKGVTTFQIIIKNSGVNTMNYLIQAYTGSAWVDLGDSGSVYYNTLTSGQVRSIQVESSYPQVQITGNASGGAFLEFSAQAQVNRPSGGSFTILPI